MPREPNLAEPTLVGDALASGAEPTHGVPSGEATIVGNATVPREPEAPLGPGARLGRYVLAEPLGQGGMGTVYSAHDPDLDRQVAIKVLHAGLAAQDATEGPQRLLREAQAMAKLSHPNVLTVHDVGVVGARLFIAMEMIEGSDLRGWLAGRRRPWRAIVEVFMAAGAGLAAAHDAGIIHRDFKPDNVLMARNGRVLVGDFGIAAAAPDAMRLQRDGRTHSWLGEAGTLTVPGALLGTPAYMAPEQMAGAEITPAVDIFAFCVALYEAIAGERPFRGDTLANLYVAIQSEGPRPLAVKVPRRLARALRRGLAADPRARHESMHALLAELRPLVASRRRLWLGGAALVVVTAAVSAGLWAASADPVQCSGGEAAVAEVWTPARRGAIEAAFTATKVVHAANTWTLAAGRLDAFTAAWSAARLDACEATNLRGEQSAEVLDRRMVCLDRQLGELDRLLVFLGEADAKVVDHAIALVLDLPAASKCDASVVLAAAPRELSPELAALELTITASRRLYRVGKYVNVIEQLTPVIERLTELGDVPLLARVLTLRASTGYVDSRPEARAWSAEALAATMRAGDDLHFAEVAASQLGLDGADVVARDLWLRLAEAALQRHGGDDSVRAKLLTNLGNALRSDGRLAEAEAAHREVLALRRRSPESPTPIADALFNIGAVLSNDPARVPEARQLMQEATDIWTRELGPQHPRMITVHSNLAMLAMDEADYRSALEHAGRALALARALRGEQHPDVAHQLAVLAMIENLSGDFVAAKQHFDRALEILTGTAGSAARQVRYGGLVLTAASFRVESGDLVGAEADLGRFNALGLKLPPEHGFWLGEPSMRAQIALARGDLDGTLREIARGRELVAKFPGPDQGESIMFMALAEAEVAVRRARFAEGFALIEPLLGAHPVSFKAPKNRALLAFLSARILWGRGQKDEALAAAEAALAAYASLGPGFDPREAEVKAWIAGHGPR